MQPATGIKINNVQGVSLLHGHLAYTTHAKQMIIVNIKFHFNPSTGQGGQPWL